MSGSKVAFACVAFLNLQNPEKSKEESELPLSLLLEKKMTLGKKEEEFAAYIFFSNLYFNHFRL